jgi:hypothetical protein
MMREFNFRETVEGLFGLLKSLGREDSANERLGADYKALMQNNAQETNIEERLKLKQVLSHKVLTVRIDSMQLQIGMAKR